MADKLNCWEYQNCGREPGGTMADDLGICPVATAMRYDGDNSGRAGGRVCWTIPVSSSNPSLKSCVDKACSDCAFFRRVQFEEEQPTIRERKVTTLPPVITVAEIA